MATTISSNKDVIDTRNVYDSQKSAVSWAAIIAGAVTASAVSLALLFLGSALGLASVSPWEGDGVSATAFGLTAAIWLIVMQWASSAFGGYMAGRLRTKWANVQTDEVFFRDTAHGFLTWALATIITAAFLASAVSSAVSGASKAATAVAAGAAAGAGQQAAKQDMGNPTDYFVDSMFRTDAPRPDVNADESRAETARILLNGVANDGISEDDKAYLAQMVASRTNLTSEEATARVNEVLAKAEAAKQKAMEQADEARKAASKAALFTFLSMLVGAFIASVSAALGGKLRDEY